VIIVGVLPIGKGIIGLLLADRGIIDDAFGGGGGGGGLTTSLLRVITVVVAAAISLAVVIVVVVDGLGLGLGLVGSLMHDCSNAVASNLVFWSTTSLSTYTSTALEDKRQYAIESIKNKVGIINSNSNIIIITIAIKKYIHEYTKKERKKYKNDVPCRAGKRS
jgi:hypothetical protein